MLPEACFGFEEPVSGTAGVLAEDAACLVRSGCWWRDSEEEEKVDLQAGGVVYINHTPVVVSPKSFLLSLSRQSR